MVINLNAKKFFYEFGREFYKIDAYYAEFAKKSGVQPRLLWVLYALNDGESHTQKEICETWILPRTTVNTIVKELESQRYVVLSQIKGKKREMNVTLTDTGKAYADEKLARLYEIEDRLFDSLTDTDKQVINHLKTLVCGLERERKNIEINFESFLSIK